jgi:signal transduction histidine kinase
MDNCGTILLFSLAMLKFFELNSIRHRMLSGFLFLTLMIFIIGGVSLYLFDQISTVATSHRQINQLQVFTLNLIKTDNDFFDFEVTNEDYFRNRQSLFLTERDSLLKLIESGVNLSLTESRDYNQSLVPYLTSIDSLFEQYNAIFEKLEQLVYTRGFKDYGLEGSMRRYAHRLETQELDTWLVDVLMMRRHEKDFLLRHDTIYKVHFNDIAKRLLTIFRQDTIRHRKDILNLIEYQRLFNERAAVEQQIGLNSQVGLRNKLNGLTTQLSKQYFSLTWYAGKVYYSIQRDVRIFYIIITCGAILFSVLSAFWISKRLSEPIARLSKLANSAATSSMGEVDFSMNRAANEINVLTGSFKKMIDQTNHQLREIKEKSTLLKVQNDELNKLNEELDNFLYSAAHDLRAPLASLLGIIRLMKMENNQENLIPYLEMMQGSIKRQEDFILQIVNYAKNKKLDVLPEELDLKTIIHEIFQNHEFVPGSSAIDKYIQIKSDVPFFSDRNRIHIIFNNLISNGIRYADPEKQEQFIQIRIHITEDEAIIEFADNGVGIGSEHIAKIFNMFYRAHIYSKGSGLGLFIFREAIHKLKGLVTVESELKVGTKFFIKLPNQYHLQKRIPLLASQIA